MSLSEDAGEKRQYHRFQFREPVSYELFEQNSAGGCLAYDISEGGIRVHFNDFVSLDTEMTFRVQLDKDQPMIDLKGHVVWVQRVPFSDRYQVGLQFEDIGAYPQFKEGIHGLTQSRRN